ncbi:Flagellar Member 4 [Diplonema papillatum]|nr:Flagellar Member 4 [Diplonema papillatum]
MQTGSSPERHEPREFGSDEHFDQVSDAGRSEPDYDCDLGQTSSGTDGRATAGGRNSLLLLDEEREELERTARLASQELEVAKRRERRVRQCEAVSQGFLAEAALREVEAQHATDAWHRVEETLSDELQELEKEAALIREIGGAEDAALNEVVEEVRVVKSKVDEVAKLQKEVLDEVSEREIEAITRQIEFEESTAKASEEDEEEVEEPELEPESEPSNTSKLPNSIARGDNVTAEGDNTGVGRRTGGKKPKRVTSRSAIAHSIARRERAADRMDTVDDKTVDLLNGARARGKNRMLSRVARLQNDLKGIPSQEKAALDELQLLIAEEKIKHSEDEALILQRIRDIAKQKRDRNDAVRRGIAADAKKHQGRAYRATRGRGKAEHTAKRPGEPDSDSSEDSSSCSTASDEAAGDTSESHVVNGRAKHSRRRRSSVVGIPGFTPTNLSKNGLLAKPIDYDVDDFTTEDWGIVVERLARKRDELLKKVQRKARRDDRKDERAHTLAESALRRVHDARRGAAQAKKRVLEDVLQYAPDTAEERRARAQRKLKELQASEELDEATMQQEKKELANLEAAARADRNARRAHVDTLTTAYADEIKQLRAAKSKKHVIDASARRIPLETPGNVRKAAKPSQSGGTQQKTSGEDGLGYDIDPYRPNGPQGGNFGQGMRFGKAQQGYDGDWDGLPAYGSVETGRRHVFLSEQKGDAAWELFLAERARVREALRVKREAFADARAAEELERSLSWREWLRLQRLENLREERERLKRLRELAGKQAKWRDQLLARLRGKEEREMEEKRRLQQAIADRQIRVDRFLRGRQQAADRAKEEKMQTLHERTRRMQQREREAELRLVSLRQEEAAQRIERQRTARVGGVKHRKRSGDVTGSPHVVFTGTEGHQSGRTGKIGISTRRAVQLSRKERETIEKEQFDREAARLRDLAEAKRLRGKLLTLLRNRLEDLQSGTVVQGVPESSQRDLRQFEREKRKAEQEKILAEKARQQARLRARIEHDRHASELRRAFILEQHALAKQQRLHSKANAPVYVGVSEDNVSTAFSSTGHPVVIQAFPSKPVNGAPSRTGRLASTNGTDRGLASIVEENTGSQARSFAPFIVTGYKPGGTAGNTARRRSVSNQQKRVRPAEQVEFDLSPDVTSLRTQRQSHALVCSDDVEDRLESTAWRLESEEFHERAAEYEKLRMSTRAVYLSECTRGRMKPNSLFTKACSDKPMHFVLKELDLGSNYVASITPFLDIIRLSKGMKRIMLRDNGLRNEDVRSLAETLQDHPSIEELDLTGNKHLTVVAGRLLLSLVQYRQRMTAVRLQGTNVPSNVVQQISRCLDWNAQGRQIAPGQVQMAAKMFDEIDTDNDGIVSAVEAEQYGKKHAQAQAMPLRRASLASGASTDVRFLQKLRNAATARDIMRVATDSTKVTFPEFLQAVFPQCPKTQILQAAATRPLASDAPQHPSPNDKSAQRRSFARTPQVSSTEIDTFFHNYAQDGYLSLEQLAAGLGESDTAKLHPIFLAFDSDEDNLLTLDEFREFMSAV